MERGGAVAGTIWGDDAECVFGVWSETWCDKIHAERFLVGSVAVIVGLV